MKVCGFSFLRNAVKYDYPFEEAIRSILPLCDQVIVAVGNSEDNTVERVLAIDPKVKILNTIWDESLRAGGKVLALETDKAFQSISSDFDWAFYIQGDEVLHEKYIPVVEQAMKENLNNPEIDGLLFKYLHFFGSYNYIGLKHSWYRREIRVIKNNKEIFSYKDAQGFRKKINEKLKVKLIDAYIYHYGWVRDPQALQGKEKEKIRFYRGDQWIKDFFSKADKYEYNKMIEPVKKFTDSHPFVMRARIIKQEWVFEPDPSLKYASRKDKIKRIIGETTGWYPGEYRNYKIV
jgi:hypothetical protein